jgi:hypothetical protein
MTDSIDRQAAVAGGLVVSDVQEPGEDQGALLALEDGSVWRGSSVGPSRAVTGRVEIRGDAVLVQGDVAAVVRGIDVRALKRHLGETAAGQGPGTMACLTAPGAVLPIHAAVAQAIARGEIGRP